MGLSWGDVKNAITNPSRAQLGWTTGGGSEIYNELSKGGLYGPSSTLGYGLDQAFNPNVPNPADEALKKLAGIPDILKGNYEEQKGLFNPYMKQGQAAYDQLNPIYGSMTKDPAAYLQNMMNSYAPSKAYQLRRDEMLRAAGNTAAAGGTRGTVSDIMNESRLTDSLLGEDMQQWLNNVMGIQGRGMQGLGNFYDTGFNAAGRLGQAGQAYSSDLANLMNQEAGMKFQGQAQQNQADADRRNQWFQLLGPIIGAGVGAGIKKYG